MVQITIDGHQIEVPSGTTILAAARSLGIKIPTLCNHPKLTPYGSCRLCVVEIEGFKTLQTSCTMVAANGMVVRTDTPKVHDARKFVLSMLFSERNHFCMFCQVSNDTCELQSSALKEGMTYWPMPPLWKPFPVDASHPYLVLDHNRCILCRRCVRACGELVGNFTLGNEERGANTMLIADQNVPFGESSCVKCGTCMQVCPTGAIMDRHSAYLGRVSTAEHVKSICVGCSVGCGIDVIIRDNQVLRIDGDWEAPVNQGLLCELGRFKSFYEDKQRILKPMVRKNGTLTPISWEEAITLVADKIKQQVGSSKKGVAALISTRQTAETISLFRTIFRDHLKSDMVTSIEERGTTHSLLFDKQFISQHGNLQTLKEADCIVAIGTDLFKNHQVAGFFIKRKLLTGTKLIVIDPGKNDMEERAHYVLKPQKGTDYELIAGMVTEIIRQKSHKAELANVEQYTKFSVDQVSKTTGVPNTVLQNISRVIIASSNPVFVYGKGLIQQETEQEHLHPLKALADLALITNGKLFTPRGKANSLAAQAHELNLPFEPKGYEIVYLTLGDDEISDSMAKRLEKVSFLIVQASHVSPISEKADIVLPATTWLEQSGHYLNLEGRLQIASQSLEPPEDVRSNTAILQAIARRIGIETDWKTTLEQYIME